MMLSVTVDQVLDWSPCDEYTRERIEELFAGRKKVNAHDVLAMGIPDADKLWAVLREEFIPAEALHEFACRVAEQALLKAREVGREPDARSWQAIKIKRRWLKGEASDSDRAAIWAAARAAAWSASVAVEGAVVRVEQVKILKELLGEGL